MGEGTKKYGVRTKRVVGGLSRMRRNFRERAKINENRKKAQEQARQKQDVNSGLNSKEIATLAKLESKNATRKREQLNVVDENGKVVFSKNGGKGSVRLYAWEAAQLKDKVVTHNHPTDKALGDGMASRIGTPINAYDVGAAIRNNAKEIRASAQGYVYSVKRPKGGWGNIDSKALEKDYEDALKRETAVWGRRYVNDGKTIAEKYNRQGRYNVGLQNETMRKLAKKYGLTYTRRKMS